MLKELEEMSITSDSNLVQSRDYGFGRVAPL